MAEYTVVLVRMMSQVRTVQADDLKAAVADAIDQATLNADSGNDFDDAGEVEVSCVDENGVTVWSDGDDEAVLFS